MGSIPDNKLELIQNRIKQYGIRFPVAKIVEQTGFDKGYVSGVLNGKKPVSDKFWSTFDEKFPAQNGAQLSADPKDIILPLGNITRTLADYINLIEFYNKTLSDAIRAGLLNLIEGQEKIKDQVAILGDDLTNQLDGISSGLAAVKTDKVASGQARKNVKGNNSRSNKDGK
jgi:hypothetical protein